MEQGRNEKRTVMVEGERAIQRRKRQLFKISDRTENTPRIVPLYLEKKREAAELTRVRCAVR